MPTEPQLPEPELTRLIREHIEEGKLPLIRPDHIEGRHGSREQCVACDRLIEPDKIEYDIDAGSGARLKFHFACYVIWQRECTARLKDLEQQPRQESARNPKTDDESDKPLGKPWWRRELDLATEALSSAGLYSRAHGQR
jgi:hypothetical protein